MIEGETLENGIHVHKLRQYDFDEEEQWIASIRIANWYYCQGGDTKEEAIEHLFIYMRKLRSEFEDTLKRDMWRLEELIRFLGS
jgi:hypothetical protein